MVPICGTYWQAINFISQSHCGMDNHSPWLPQVTTIYSDYVVDSWIDADSAKVFYWTNSALGHQTRLISRYLCLMQYTPLFHGYHGWFQSDLCSDVSLNKSCISNLNPWVVPTGVTICAVRHFKHGLHVAIDIILMDKNSVVRWLTKSPILSSCISSLSFLWHVYHTHDDRCILKFCMNDGSKQRCMVYMLARVTITAYQYNACHLQLWKPKDL